jgi:FkbM family methyltransferase
VPDTFELLAAAACLAPFPNITLFNAAASDLTTLASMSIPRLSTGLPNYYRAHLGDGPPDVNTLCVPIDALQLRTRVAFVKIDAEGHELAVLRGMTALLGARSPHALVEDSSQSIADFLDRFGYSMTRQADSPNVTFSV